MTASAASTSRRSRVPQWLVEGLDLVEQRRRALLITFALVVVVATIVAYAAPGVLPPTVLVGAAIGLGGLLLAVAVLIALDTADLIVRGPRHVRAAGGELVAVLPSEPSVAGAVRLAKAIEEVRPQDRTLLLGMAAATGDGRRAARWADSVARALADHDTSVLSLDLTGEGTAQPGFLEVVRDGAKLASVVELEEDVRLARLGAGRDGAEAVRAFNEAGRWLPRDLEVLLVALPMAASRPVVRASLSLDQLLIVAERDKTSRVELIAGLDATEAVGTHSQVVLIDDAYAAHLGLDSNTVPIEPSLEHAPVQDPATDLEHAAEPERVAAPESVGIPDPVVAQESEVEDGPGPDTPDSYDWADEIVAPATPDSPLASPQTTELSEPPVDDPRDAHDGHDGSGARDLDVMMGAAAASALASVTAEADEEAVEQPGTDLPEEPRVRADRSEPRGADELTIRVRRPEPLEEETTLEVKRPEPVDVGEVAASPDVEPPAQPEPSQPWTGHEAEAQTPLPPIDVDDPSLVDDDDMLNTTARLSLLIEEMESRGTDDQDDAT